jgi:hypothetical protein
MAEERNLVQSGAPETTAADTDATKQELQRRMEEAREQISQTVTEIKETVVSQYQQVRSSINESLDWREQFRRRPVPFAAGAFGAGLILGYAVAGSFGDDEDDYDDETQDSFARIESGFDQLRTETARKPYAASPILGQAASFGTSGGGGGSASAASRASMDVGPDTRPSYDDEYRPAVQTTESTSAAASGGGVRAGFGSFETTGGAGATEAASGGEQSGAAAEPKGPTLFDRFKETKAYERLQDELTSVGERVVEELSRTAQTVVIPALLSRLKDMIGIDLGTQRQVAQRTRLETQAAQGQQEAQQASEGGQTSGGQGGGQSGQQGSANFATSGRGA